MKFSKAESDLVEAKEDKEAVMLELEQLANYKAELHSSCDFVRIVTPPLAYTTFRNLRVV